MSIPEGTEEPENQEKMRRLLKEKKTEELLLQQLHSQSYEFSFFLIAVSSVVDNDNNQDKNEYVYKLEHVPH